MNDQKSSPLVSFVVPCYKFAHLLPQCVNSILSQDYANFEVLIMDNCSPDNTPEVAQSFQDSRVRHIRNESNLGHIRNYNKGISLAQGKYVWVLSADDLLRSPAVLGRYVERMENNPQIGLVFCRAVELQGKQEGAVVRWADCGDQDRTWNDSEFFVRLMEANCIVMSSVIMRKTSLDRVGLFPVDLPFACDWYLWSTLAMHFGVGYFAEPMVFCRYHEDSLTTRYGHDYARVCVGDELTVLSRIGKLAEAEQRKELRDSCGAALVRRVHQLLMSGLRGLKPSITATEFEEILKSRQIETESTGPVRTAVYSGLVNDVRSMYYLDGTTTDLSTEIGCFWDLWRHAQLAGVSALADVCKEVLIHRLFSRLQNDSLQSRAGFAAGALVETIRTQIPDQPAAKEIQYRVFSELAERQYTRGDFASAADSYRLALAAHPGDAATSAKYLLLKLGAPGIWLRQFSHQLREAGRRN